ncbi:hypothetical protein [Actinophytocola sp. KF-1]
MIIRVWEAVVGEIVHLRSHPNAERIWLADVRSSRHGRPEQIVFGGTRKLRRGDLVAVAPPGTLVQESHKDRPRRMRARSYRGQRSHGMLCSLDELGWARGGPNEVAVLKDLRPGFVLDELDPDLRPAVVKKWERSIDTVDTMITKFSPADYAALSMSSAG